MAMRHQESERRKKEVGEELEFFSAALGTPKCDTEGSGAAGRGITAGFCCPEIVSGLGDGSEWDPVAAVKLW